MIDQRQRPTKGPGRPPADEGGEDVRSRLIEAAAKRFSERGYRGSSIREIAAAADVTPAMVAYYFGDKLGLLEAVLDSVFARLLPRIQELASRPARGRSFLERFIDVYLEVLGGEAWVPHFIVREVLSEDTPVRSRFVERFASRAAEIVPALFQQQMDEGALRNDLEPRLLLLSILGMCLFPLIAEPVLGPLLGYAIDEDFIARLTRHTQGLLLQGAQP